MGSVEGAGKKTKRLGKAMVITREELETQEPDARSELIRALVPLGLAEIERTLQEKVRELGRRAVRAG